MFDNIRDVSVPNLFWKSCSSVLIFSMLRSAHRMSWYPATLSMTALYKV